MKNLLYFLLVLTFRLSAQDSTVYLVPDEVSNQVVADGDEVKYANFSSGWLAKINYLISAKDFNQSSYLSMELGGEIAIGKKMSLNFSAGGLSYYFGPEVLQRPFWLESRYYVKKDQLSKDRSIYTTNDQLSGSYFSVHSNFGIWFNAGIDTQSLDQDYKEQFFGLSSGQAIVPKFSVGVTAGRQYWGLVDLGIRIEMINTYSKTSFSQQLNSFVVKSNNGWGLRSFYKFTLPFAGFKKRVVYRPNCDVIHCLTNYKHLFKFGLQDVFNVSNVAVLLNPEIGFEVPLGKSGLSFNSLLTANYFSENRFERVTVGFIPDQKFTYTEMPSKISERRLSMEAQLRYYAFRKREIMRGKDIGALEGFYVSADALLGTSILNNYDSNYTNQQKKASSFGGGLGYQKLLFKKILMDLNFAVTTPDLLKLEPRSRAEDPILKPFRNERKLIAKGGVKLYWVK